MARSRRTPSHAANLGRIPKRDVGSWCREIISKCTVSRDDRVKQAQTYRNFYFTGTDDGAGAVDNEIFPEVDHLASSLFSPLNPRFTFSFDHNDTPEEQAKGHLAASYLSRDFRRRGVDLCFSQGVNWGLVDSCSFIKLLWGRNGFDPYLIAQGFMGVYHEGLTSLDRQDAFVHTSFMTLATFERSISGHPEERTIMNYVKRRARQSNDLETNQHDVRALLIGGTIPVNLTPPQSNIPGGWVNWVKGPRPVLDRQTLSELVQVDELWVIDNDREDYTTFQCVDEIVIEGKLQRRNLLDIQGVQPFVQVSPNPVIDYFWGRSEIAQLMIAQNAITAQVNGISRTMRMQEDPPMTFNGMTGNVQEKRSALMKPGGKLAENNPNFKVTNEAPKLPEQALPFLEDLRSNFHRQGGFEAPVSRGMGEQGVRSGVHGDTMVRMASPRLRDRALDIERTYTELGDLGFQILQAKVPDKFKVTPEGKSTPIEFILDQISTDYDLSVDSHSSSPAFSQEARTLAFDLAKVKAIDDKGLIRLTHPPQEDNLLSDIDERRKKQAETLAAHPELLRSQGRRS
jgi:hypothetical protein